MFCLRPYVLMSFSLLTACIGYWVRQGSNKVRAKGQRGIVSLLTLRQHAQVESINQDRLNRPPGIHPSGDLLTSP